MINGEKITNERFLSLENEVINLKSKVENISNSLEDKTQNQNKEYFIMGKFLMRMFL